MKIWFGAAALAFAIATPALAHQGFLPREEVIHNTPEWKGERFPDGRPKVPDAILDRMKSVTLEEAWATLRFAGYEQQYEDGWDRLYPDKILVGRPCDHPPCHRLQSLSASLGARESRLRSGPVRPESCRDRGDPSHLHIAVHSRRNAASPKPLPR